MLGWASSGLKLVPFDPSALARSPLGSTSTASTCLPARAASSAMAAVTVVFPVPPLPATKMIRRASSASRLPGAALTARRLRGRGGRLENRGGMAGGLDCAPLLRDIGPVPDQEGAALDALVRLPVHRLVHPEIERTDEHVVGVADEWDGELALRGEPVVALSRIGGDPVDVDAPGPEVVEQGGELVPFDGAAGSVVLGIEVEDGAAPEQVRAAQPLTPAHLQVEVRQRRCRPHVHP